MSTAAKYGDLDLGSVPHVTTVEEFLVALNIPHLLPKFTARGVTTIEHLLHLLPSDIDAMGIRAGVRVRLLKGCSLLREHNSSERSNVDATASGTTSPTARTPRAATPEHLAASAPPGRQPAPWQTAPRRTDA